MIVRALGVTKGMVAGIINRARQMGRLPNPKDKVYVPTPNRFPRSGCLYMEGDPKNPAAKFCGRPVFRGAWCAKHRKIVFRPIPDISNLIAEAAD